MGRRAKREALLRMEREMTQAEQELAALRTKISQASSSLLDDQKEGSPNAST